MNKDREPNQQQDQTAEQNMKNRRDRPHSSAFNETTHKDEKSTTNIEEEASSEQERKDAMTERD